MPVGPIAVDVWVPVRDAALRMAEELNGEPPPLDFLERPECHQRLYDDLRSDVHHMVCSGEVACHVDNGVRISRLDAAHARHFATFVDVRKSTICIEGAPEWVFPLEVNRLDLDRYLAANRSRRRTLASERGSPEQVLSWFREKLKSLLSGDKQRFKVEATSRLQISGRRFEEIWRVETSAPEFAHLRAGGRPPKPSH